MLIMYKIFSAKKKKKKKRKTDRIQFINILE